MAVVAVVVDFPLPPCLRGTGCKGVSQNLLPRLMSSDPSENSLTHVLAVLYSVPVMRNKLTDGYFVSHETFIVDPAEKTYDASVLGLMNTPSGYLGGGGRYVVV